jgi:hypothetical protein
MLYYKTMHSLDHHLDITHEQYAKDKVNMWLNDYGPSSPTPSFPPLQNLPNNQDSTLEWMIYDNYKIKHYDDALSHLFTKDVIDKVKRKYALDPKRWHNDFEERAMRGEWPGVRTLIPINPILTPLPKPQPRPGDRPPPPNADDLQDLQDLQKQREEAKATGEARAAAAAGRSLSLKKRDFNDDDEMKDLLATRGTPVMVSNTIALFKESGGWDDFMKNAIGRLVIQPYSIKNLLFEQRAGGMGGGGRKKKSSRRKSNRRKSTHRKKSTRRKYTKRRKSTRRKSKRSSRRMR